MSEELARDFINSALDARDLLRRLQVNPSFFFFFAPVLRALLA